MSNVHYSSKRYLVNPALLLTVDKTIAYYKEIDDEIVLNYTISNIGNIHLSDIVVPVELSLPG